MGVDYYYGIPIAEVRCSSAFYTFVSIRFDVLAFHSSIQFEPGFTAVSILHPATYLNKVLVASSQGSMQLWNIRTQLAPPVFRMSQF